MKSTLAFLPVSLLLIASPAFAETPARGAETVEVRVSHRDLDLTNPAGVAVLERRVATATKRVCPPMTQSLRDQMAARKCRRAAAEGAAEQTEVAITEAASRSRFAGGAGADGADKTVLQQ